jgi:hypothetical protein
MSALRRACEAAYPRLLMCDADEDYTYMIRPGSIGVHRASWSLTANGIELGPIEPMMLKSKLGVTLGKPKNQLHDGDQTVSAAGYAPLPTDPWSRPSGPEPEPSIYANCIAPPRSPWADWYESSGGEQLYAPVKPNPWGI